MFGCITLGNNIIQRKPEAVYIKFGVNDPTTAPFKGSTRDSSSSMSLHDKASGTDSKRLSAVLMVQMCMPLQQRSGFPRSPDFTSFHNEYMSVLIAWPMFLREQWMVSHFILQTPDHND